MALKDAEQMQFPDIDFANDWLEEKPSSFRFAICARMALRLLPLTLNWSRYDPDEAKPRVAGMVFLSASNLHFTLCPEIEEIAAGMASHLGIVLHPDMIDGGACGPAMLTQRIFHRVGNKSWEMRQSNFQGLEAKLVRHVYDDGTKSLEAAYPSSVLTNTSSWFDAAIEDCNWLAKNETTVDAAWVLMGRPLWFSKIPTWVNSELSAAKGFLDDLGKSFAVWFDWYDRRLLGAEEPFRISMENNVELFTTMNEAKASWGSDIESEIERIFEWLNRQPEYAGASAIDSSAAASEAVDFARLARDLEQLREIASDAARSRSMLGHNNPPEEIDDQTNADIVENLTSATTTIQNEISSEQDGKGASLEKLIEATDLLAKVNAGLLTRLQRLASQLKKKALDISLEEMLRAAFKWTVNAIKTVVSTENGIIGWFSKFLGG